MTQNQDNTIDIDSELMLKAQKGDIKSFETIVKKYQNILLNYFYYLNANSQEAEDLVQDTFLKLYLYRDKYTPSAKLKTFLIRIARNTAIDFYRKMKPVSVDMQYDRNVDDKDLNRSSQQLESEDLRKAINMLPEKSREVIVMSYFEELKYQEISEILEVPIGTIKSRMSYAMKQLKEILEKRRN